MVGGGDGLSQSTSALLNQFVSLFKCISSGLLSHHFRVESEKLDIEQSVIEKLSEVLKSDTASKISLLDAVENVSMHFLIDLRISVGFSNRLFHATKAE